MRTALGKTSAQKDFMKRCYYLARIVGNALKSSVSSLIAEVFTSEINA
jgi:hypothetical protein